MRDETRLDALVRGTLADLPVPDEVETRRALRRVLDRSPARRSTPAWLVPAAIAAVVVLIAAVVPALVTRHQSQQPPATPSASPAGSWHRQVTGARTSGWDGSWTMTLAEDGVVTLTARPQVDDAADGSSYDVVGSTMRVDAFVNSVCAELPAGTYRWNQVGSTLTLTLVHDPCPARSDLFAGAWQRAG